MPYLNGGGAAMASLLHQGGTEFNIMTRDPHKVRKTPNGLACAACRKVKTRCKWTEPSDTEPCQRCARLDKVCESPQGHYRIGAARAATQMQQATQSTSISVPERHADETSGVTSSTASELTPASSTKSVIDDISAAQAEENLRVFRTSYLPCFPAVHIPLISSTTLRDERPNLWLAIQSVCCKPLSLRTAVQEQARRTFAEMANVQYAFSIDLLLGLIVIAAWGTITTCNTLAYHTSATMATSVAQNLRLERTPGPHITGFKAIAYGFHPNYMARLRVAEEQDHQSYKRRTYEERRAILACYALNSSTFHKLGTPPMRWTMHMDACILQLQTQPECEGDEILAVMVKCLRILDDICLASPCAFQSGEANDGAPKMIPTTLDKAFKARLDEVTSHFRSQILEKRIVKFWVLLTEAFIQDLNLQTPGMTPTAARSFARADTLQSCIITINLFLDNLLAFKPQEHSGLHFHYWLYHIRVVQIAYRLLHTDDPAWDRNIIAESVDVLGSLQKVQEICRAIPAANGLQSNGKEAHSVYATNLQAIRSVWQEALSLSGISVPGQMAGNVEQGIQMPDFDDMLSFDLLNNDWMSNSFAMDAA